MPLITASATPVITVAATISAGDSLSVEVDSVVYVADDGNLIDNGDGSWSLTIPASNALSDGSYEVLARVADAAGNSTSDASVGELHIDLSASSAPVGSITSDVNDDGLLSLAESVDLVDIQIDLPADASPGDNIHLSDGSLSQSVVLTSADIAAGSISSSFNWPAEGEPLSIVAIHIDGAGNTSPPRTDSVLIDTMPTPAPVVHIIEDADDNAFIGSTELIGDVNIRVYLPASTLVGDTLVVSIDGSDMTYVLGPVNLAAGAVNVVATSPGDTTTLSVTASIIDEAGNTSLTGSDSAVLDLTPPVVPSVNALISNTGTPVLGGLADLSVRETPSITLDSRIYAVGDGSLVINNAGNWSLSAQSTHTLPEGD